MKMLERWKHLNKPRASGTGKIWDNVNTPGGVKPPLSSMSTINRTVAPTRSYTPGPNIEPYLKTAEWKNPDRQVVHENTLLPRIAVREPWAVSSTYVQNVGPQTANPPSGLPPGSYVDKIKSLAPPMIRQRELIFDAAKPENIRTPQAYTESQVYFNQRTPLPEYTTPSMPSNMVTTHIYPVQPGWEQPYVPEPGLRENEITTAPPFLLSTPLTVTTIIRGGDGRRTSTTGAKAPKRKRTG